MNKLGVDKQIQILTLLLEGNSLRATSRITGTSINTVTGLLVRVGKGCIMYHNTEVRNILCRRLQCDEIWSFVYSKHRDIPKVKQDHAGETWTWVGIDADTKLVISWLVGLRTAEHALLFMRDISSRINNRFQLTTDGFTCYKTAVEEVFKGHVDYAQTMTTYIGGDDKKTHKKYSPTEIANIERVVIYGKPERKYITNSYVERQNLTMRTNIRRFTRLTNAFSKKLQNHIYAVALHFVYYNFCRIHSSLRVTPAMESGLRKDIMKLEEVVRLGDEFY